MSGDVILRGLKPGDLGHIVARHGVLYAAEHGWDWTYEGLVAGIAARFVEGFDPAREQAWIADRDGEVVGSIFLMKGDDAQTAKLRLLYLEPSVRGLGVGRRLVDACVRRAREVGYERMELWTCDLLVPARRLYEATGFKLRHSQAQRLFGHDLTMQTWALDF